MHERRPDPPARGGCPQRWRASARILREGVQGDKARAAVEGGPGKGAGAAQGGCSARRPCRPGARTGPNADAGLLAPLLGEVPPPPEPSSGAAGGSPRDQAGGEDRAPEGGGPAPAPATVRAKEQGGQDAPEGEAERPAAGRGRRGSALALP